MPPPAAGSAPCSSQRRDFPWSPEGGGAWLVWRGYLGRRQRRRQRRRTGEAAPPGRRGKKFPRALSGWVGLAPSASFCTPCRPGLSCSGPGVCFFRGGEVGGTGSGELEWWFRGFLAFPDPWFSGLRSSPRAWGFVSSRARHREALSKGTVSQLPCPSARGRVADWWACCAGYLRPVKEPGL
uniref:Uncharacterized protein n=1 Tax=Lynx canadensis TaxID=61383 RepID=A0A667H0T7_LYNCA